MHIYINLSGYRIPTYGLLVSSGVVLANLIALLYIRKKYKNDCLEDFLILEAYGFLGAFAGAKMLYIIVSYKTILWSNILDAAYFNKIMQGGFVFYGGLFGGIYCIWLGGKIHKIPVREYLEHYIFLIPLIHSFGRVGCFEAGCCYGIPYSGYGSVIFPENSFAPSGISLLPIQLIEAVCLLVLAVVILVLQLQWLWKYTVETYLISYGILRFILEFFRFDQERGTWGIFSVSQIISLSVIVITAIIYREEKVKCMEKTVYTVK